MEIIPFLLGFTFLALGVTGAGLAVAAIHGLLSQRTRPAGDEFAGHVRAGSCAALRQYSAWWLACAAAWLVAALVLRTAGT